MQGTDDGATASNPVERKRPRRPGPFVAFLQWSVKTVHRIANSFARPIVLRRLAPIQIPFIPRPPIPPGLPGGGPPAPNPEGGAEEDDVFWLPPRWPTWGPVRGGYWGLDGRFHRWSGVPPIPTPPPPLPQPQPPAPDPTPPGSPDPGDDDAPGGNGDPEDDGQEDDGEDPDAEDRRRRIEELEDELARILEEMQMFWPLLDDLLGDEFDARREEILELDPTWTFPGTGPPIDDEPEPPPWPP